MFDYLIIEQMFEYVNEKIKILGGFRASEVYIENRKGIVVKIVDICGDM